MEGNGSAPEGYFYSDIYRRIPPSFLKAVSRGYAFAVRFRLFLYRKGILRSRRPPLKVLSIGNLTVGGSGKTPHTALLARYLRDKGVKTAVLSRGYGGRKSKEGAVLSDGQSLLAGWEEGGEESLWLAKSLPGVPVLIGRDRFRSALYCRKAWQTEWVILDDGFQHLRLQRDVDLLLIPVHASLETQKLLPLGPLREPPEEAKRADIILFTHMERGETRVTDRLRETVRRLAPFTPIYSSFHRPARLTTYPQGEEVPLNFLAGKKVLAFCGLGDPGSFAHTLKEIGAETVRMVPFPDHHRYSEKDKLALENLCREWQRPWLVTTEKDALKLEGWKPKGADLLVLGIEVEIPEKGFWELMDQMIGREVGR